MEKEARPLIWLHGEIRTPPFSRAGRIIAGVLLRRLQLGDRPGMPDARPMPGIGPSCLELRIRDRGQDWRIVCALAPEAVVILDVFSKKSRGTPQSVIATCRDRLRRFQRTR